MAWKVCLQTELMLSIVFLAAYYFDYLTERDLLLRKLKATEVMLLTVSTKNW